VLIINEEIAKSHILKFHNWIDWEIGSFFDHSIAENKKPLHIVLRQNDGLTSRKSRSLYLKGCSGVWLILTPH
jgi:hypothetical protein